METNNIRFVKANPTENITLLVLDYVERKDQPGLAAELLRRDLEAEQVGFIESPQLPGAVFRLQMMGGEFCGNGTMAAGVMYAADRQLELGDTLNIPIEVSGADGIVNCSVKAENDFFVGTVDIPLGRGIKVMNLCYDGRSYECPVVFLQGIVHIIFPAELWERGTMSTAKEDGAAGYRGFAEKAVKDWAASFAEEDAVGLIFFSKEESSIMPLVYVKATDSLYWERGCGSGTAAVGMYMADALGEDVDLPIKQPGGTISVHAEVENSKIKRLAITGKVIIERNDKVI